MTYVANSATSNLVIINSAIIEFVYEAGSLQTIKVHQPMKTSAEDVDAIHDAIREHCSDDSVLIEEPTRMKGTIHIMEWKVVHE